MYSADKHELFYQLDAFNPHWQKVYATIRSAAEAANCLPDYYDYMQTSEGMQYRLRMQDVPDTVAQNRAERRLRERMSAITQRARKSYPEMFEDEDYDS